MKNKAIKTKLLTVLLALCMVLSLVPMTAFAATVKLPAGVSREYLYNHTYHTKVEITANVSVKDAGGSVIETTQVNKSGDFIEGNVSNTAVQTEIQRIDAEINAPFSSKGTLAVENRTTSLKFDHFDGSNLYSFVPASGDTVDFGTDTEAIEQYFAEHPDAVGTFNTFNDLHEYQVYHITYDLIVQESGTTPAAVENVKLNYENISYKAGDTPRAAASVSRGNCTVAYECWTEIRRPEGGGQWYETGRRWYSDSDKMASLPADERIINFEAGNSYQYNVVLAAGSGYSFSNDETVVSVGEDEWGTPGSHKKLEIKESGKELHIKGIYTFDLPNAGQPIAITSAAVENAKFDYKPGDAPRATATVAAADQGKYQIANEYWQELDENDVPVAAWHSDGGAYSTLPTITAFESGKKYVYAVMLLPERGYDFSREVAATVNGNSVTAVPATDGYLSLPNVKTITPTESVNTTVIDLIEINDVTVNFKDGDKPVFTGKTGNNQPYFIDHERWNTDGAGVASSAYWNDFYGDFDGSWGKRIEAFEAGKEYRYGVYLKLTQNGYTEGWRFDETTKLNINGHAVDLSNKRVDITDDGLTIWFNDVLSITPGGSDPHSHSYGTAWKYDGTNHWHECACGDKADTAAHTFKWVTDKEATATEKGSKHEECTVCGYKKAAVEIPVSGSINGSTEQPTKPGNTFSPQTGDNNSLALWFAVLLISGGAVIGTTVISRKKKYNS